MPSHTLPDSQRPASPRHAYPPASLHVCLLGATGYAGAECLALLRRHPAVGRVTTPPSSAGLAGVPLDADAVLLATPAEAAAELAAPLLARGHRVVDLSGAHRSPSPQAHEQAYGFAHPHPEALAEAVYGLDAAPDVLAAARLVANPGCYANAALSALVPLQRAGLLRPGAVADVTGISGISGAGRKLAERSMYMTVAENLAPYRPGRAHQHVVEIERALPLRLLFLPMVAPLRRGMIVTGTVEAQADEAALTDLHLPCDPLWQRATEPPDVHAVAHTPLVRVQYGADPVAGRVWFVSAIDNLLRGAASHAVFNFNRMFGLPDLDGLQDPA